LRNFSENNITDAVLERIAGATDQRAGGLSRT